VVEGYTPAAGTESVELPFMLVSDGYFETLGIPLLRGRLFRAADAERESPAILVNRAAADRFWPGEDPVGKRMRGQTSEVWRTVVRVNTHAYRGSTRRRASPSSGPRSVKPSTSWITGARPSHTVSHRRWGPVTSAAELRL
jgi:hypothetical protein